MNYKDDFPLLRQSPVAYLDNAATEQRPQAVLEAVDQFYRTANANPLRGLYQLAVDATDAYENARERVRRFVNAASTQEIVFTRNTTESLNLVAYSYGLSHLRAGDEILVTIAEHHSNLLPWQMVARTTGATLKFLDCEPDGSFPQAAIRAAVTPRTKLAAVGHVSNVTGRTFPVDLLVPLVHANGGVVGLAAALDYLEQVGPDTVHARELALTRQAMEGMQTIPGVHILGSDDPADHCGIVSFTVDGVHPHDIAAILDRDQVCIRAGHHCAQPLLAHLGVRSSARASLAFYNTEEDVARLLDSVKDLRRKMGYGA